MKINEKHSVRQRLAVVTLAVIVIFGGAAYHLRPVHAQVDLTPGMLFGPLLVGNTERAALCFSYLSPGSVTALVHFRNLTTGEVTTPQSVTVNSGGGGCVPYTGHGQVVGMARGDGPAADWVSPSNALISTMSTVDNVDHRVHAVVLGVAKMWVVGL